MEPSKGCGFVQATARLAINLRASLTPRLGPHFLSRLRSTVPTPFSPGLRGNHFRALMLALAQSINSLERPARAPLAASALDGLASVRDALPSRAAARFAFALG